MADERYTWDKTLATHRRNGPRRLEQVMTKIIDLQRLSTYVTQEEVAPQRAEEQEREYLYRNWYQTLTIAMFLYARSIDFGCPSHRGHTWENNGTWAAAASGAFGYVSLNTRNHLIILYCVM